MYRGPNHHNDGRSDANNYHPSYTDYPGRNNEEYDNGQYEGNTARPSRRVTSATMQMPSTRSIFAGGPMEPQLEPPETGMAGVAVGTIYDSSDHSSHFTHPPPGALVSNSSLPGAPYRDLMQTYSRDDPMMHRGGRLSTGSSRPRPSQRPYPQSGPPQGPNTPSVEPTVPQTRLGRRMLARKAERQPDFVPAKFADALAPVDCTNLECIMCQAALEIPKTAVVLVCPNCDEVQPVANCRILRIGSGQVG